MAGRLVFAISSDYERRTGGWIYDMRVLAELEARGWTVERLTLPAGFPEPGPEARAGTLRAFAHLPTDTLVLVESLVLSVMPELAAAEGARLRLVALLHHPLALETGLAPDRRRRAEEDERAALAGARRIVVTSTTTAAQLRQHYGVPIERIAVALPGTDSRLLARGGGNPPLLLAVGAVVPRKNHRALIAALRASIELPWRLRIVGNLTRARDQVADLQAQIRTERLADRVELAGELDDRAMEEAWDSADLFVSASRHEGFGMAVAEALARGLPVVATKAGALADWLPAAAALGVPPGDGIALGAALRRVLAEPDLRRSLREGAIAYRHELPGWESSAEAVEAALRAA